MRNIQTIWLDTDDRIRAHNVSTRPDLDANAQVEIDSGHGLTIGSRDPEALRRLARSLDEAAVLLTAEIHARQTAEPIPA